MAEPYEPPEIPDRCPVCGMSSNPYDWEDELEYVGLTPQSVTGTESPTWNPAGYSVRVTQSEKRASDG